MTNHCSQPAARFFSLLFLFFLTCFAVTAQEIPTDAANIQAGQQLFNNNCKQCHAINKVVVGPALGDVYNRAPSVEWILSFVKNPAAVIASGDAYATDLFDQYKPTVMTAFSTFSDEQILDILAYVKAETEKPVVEPTPGPGGEVAGGTSAGVPSTYLNVILIGMLIILILLLVILGFLVSAIKRFLDQKDLTEEEKEIVHSPFSLGSVVRSSGFIFIVVFLVGALGFKAVINGLYSVGIQQGYAPAQPIAFSHKIHAGQYEIDCQYCHTGASVGKNANIPSLNVCMNCHNQIRQGTITGEGEINKLVTAYNTGQPIEWVRIHNLPDLAYFNHAQHVNVGGIECQTCHGPIEEMDVVRQHSLLTMGWCIDCHRKTPVDTAGNDYYDGLVELHKTMNPGDQGFEVVDIGGMECSKCHY